MREKPRAGEIYRHFKDRLYQIVTVAVHTETGEELVVYQALYGDFRFYASPLSLFLGPLDREKYPEAGQTYRFERVDMKRERSGDGFLRTGGEQADSGEEEARVNPWLEAFLDAQGYEKQLEMLSRMRGKIGQKELDSLYLILDISPGTGDADTQLRRIIRDVETRRRYDGSRLR